MQAPFAIAAYPMVVTSVTERADAMERFADNPLRYAVGLAPSNADINLESGGVEIFSPAAVSVGLRIMTSGWPSDVVLIWRNPGGDEVHQVVVDNRQTWLPDVAGEVAVLEWDKARLGPGASLTIDQVAHGYRGLNGPMARDSGDASGCNIDVVCPQGAEWDDSIRASVLVMVDDTATTRAACSGALLNNTADDDRPLLITARHCGIRPTNVESVITFFNYQRSTCAGANDGSKQQRISGASWLAEAPQADTTLIELSQKIPLVFNVHLGGWQAEKLAPQWGVAAHHPAVDQKKSAYLHSQLRRVTTWTFPAD